LKNKGFSVKDVAPEDKDWFNIVHVLLNKFGAITEVELQALPSKNPKE